MKVKLKQCIFDPCFFFKHRPVRTAPEKGPTSRTHHQQNPRYGSKNPTNIQNHKVDREKAKTRIQRKQPWKEGREGGRRWQMETMQQWHLQISLFNSIFLSLSSFKLSTAGGRGMANSYPGRRKRKIEGGHDKASERKKRAGSHCGLDSVVLSRDVNDWKKYGKMRGEDA